MSSFSLSNLKKILRPRSRVQEALFHLKHSRFGLVPLQNLVGDLRDGCFCGGIIQSRFKEKGAYQTQHTDYRSLEEVFFNNDLGISPDDVLVDVGCGKGRVISFWLRRKLGAKYIGIELDPEVAAISAERFKNDPRVRIIQGDAVENLPVEGTLFYLWNPFNADVLQRFVDRLLAMSGQMGRIRVVYNNCRHAEVFTSNPVWEVRPVSNKDAYPAILATLKRA